MHITTSSHKTGDIDVNVASIFQLSLLSMGALFSLIAMSTVIAANMPVANVTAAAVTFVAYVATLLNRTLGWKKNDMSFVIGMLAILIMSMSTQLMTRPFGVISACNLASMIGCVAFVMTDEPNRWPLLNVTLVITVLAAIFASIEATQADNFQRVMMLGYAAPWSNVIILMTLIIAYKKLCVETNR